MRSAVLLYTLHLFVQFVVPEVVLGIVEHAAHSDDALCHQVDAFDFGRGAVSPGRQNQGLARSCFRQK